MKKRLIAVIVALATILAALAVFLIVRSVRSNRAPDLETIRPRLEALINASHDVNEIFWGEGLPTYPRVYRTYYTRVPFYVEKSGDTYVRTEDTAAKKRHYYTFTDEAIGEIVAYQYCVAEGEVGDYTYIDIQTGETLTVADNSAYRYAKKTTEAGENPIYQAGEYYYFALPEYEETEAEFYYTTSDEAYYDYVRFDASYQTIESIKIKAEQVYAEVYLSSVYETLFTGLAVEESGGLLQARYIELADSEGVVRLMQSNQQQAINVDRVYLLDTMRMSEERKSNANNLFVDVDTYLAGDEENVQTVCVSFVKQDGIWYLNSPTY